MAKVVFTVINGKVSIEGVGYTGPACEKDVEFFAAQLGDEQDKTRQHTPEYFETPTANQDQEVAG